MAFKRGLKGLNVDFKGLRLFRSFQQGPLNERKCFESSSVLDGAYARMDLTCSLYPTRNLRNIVSLT